MCALNSSSIPKSIIQDIINKKAGQHSNFAKNNLQYAGYNLIYAKKVLLNQVRASNFHSVTWSEVYNNRKRWKIYKNLSYSYYYDFVWSGIRLSGFKKDQIQLDKTTNQVYTLTLLLNKDSIEKFRKLEECMSEYKWQLTSIINSKDEIISKDLDFLNLKEKYIKLI
jgi:hypothetical protein